MKMNLIPHLSSIFILFLFSSQTLGQASLTAKQIIDKVDQNMVFATAEITSEMMVYENGKMVIYQKIHSYVVGREKSFAEVLSPARDKGTKFLKIGNLMWMYFPDADRTIKLSGHLLRQSMLGSDFSYEDVMEGSKPLKETYKLKLEGEEVVEKIPCYKISLVAKEKRTTYPKRILWVDKQRFIPIREERYSRQNKLLKSYSVKEVKKIQNRYFPVASELRDMLRKTTSTQLRVVSAKFDLPLNDKLFSRSNLRK